MKIIFVMSMTALHIEKFTNKDIKAIFQLMGRNFF